MWNECVLFSGTCDTASVASLNCGSMMGGGVGVRGWFGLLCIALHWSIIVVSGPDEMSLGGRRAVVERQGATGAWVQYVLVSPSVRVVVGGLIRRLHAAWMALSLFCRSRRTTTACPNRVLLVISASVDWQDLGFNLGCSSFCNACWHLCR